MDNASWHKRKTTNGIAVPRSTCLLICLT